MLLLDRQLVAVSLHTKVATVRFHTALLIPNMTFVFSTITDQCPAGETLRKYAPPFLMMERFLLQSVAVQSSDLQLSWTSDCRH